MFDKYSTFVMFFWKLYYKNILRIISGCRMSPQEELFGYLFWDLRNHPFPKYVEICSKHFHESDFVYLADGIRHLRVNAAPIPVHTAFDFAESIR
nr:unnamed protein product [Callosobruchus chinensis]